MTDFVITHKNPIGFKTEDERKKYYLTVYLNYALFLKQPLTLGMFVPTDLEGRAIEMPIKESFPSTTRGFASYDNALRDFNDAKDRVLFEGFEIVGNKKVGGFSYLIENGSSYNVGSVASRYREHAWDFDFDNLEQLSVSRHEIVLTPTALKQIGL